MPYSERIRKETGMKTQAVGLIWDPAHANSIVTEGKADIVALGREILSNPNWPVHAADTLGVDKSFESWPKQYGWWLDKRRGLVGR